MSRILVTGIAVLDLVCRVDHYPREDEELRALDMQRRLGGNGANMARVLAQLGHEAHLLATLAEDAAGDELLAALAAAGVQAGHCPRLPGHTPTSCILLNAASGSRTIVHHRDLAELDPGHFRALPLATFDWFHFEGRNVAATAEMLAHVRDLRVDQPVSLELEKPRAGLDALLPLADVVIAARAWAEASGHGDAPACLRALRRAAPHALLVCPWGAAGAWALDRDGSLLQQPAVAAGPVVDTLGAGDSFNAALVDALAGGHTLAEALHRACLLAGLKVSQPGFDGLAERFEAELARIEPT